MPARETKKQRNILKSKDVIIAKLPIKIKYQPVNKTDISKFASISIRGQFIYGYLCLMNSISHNKLALLPVELEELFQEFVSSEKLDEWQAKIDDILPSFILDNEALEHQYFSLNVIEKIKGYYKKQPLFLVDIIDDLFCLGLSNLYVAYNPDNSLKYLKLVLEKMHEQAVPLPDFEKIKECSIILDNHWGKSDYLKKYTKK